MTVKFTKETKKMYNKKAAKTKRAILFCAYSRLPPHDLVKMNQRNDPEPSKREKKIYTMGTSQNTKAEQNFFGMKRQSEEAEKNV